LDALVAPAGILPGHLLDQGGDGRVDGWASGLVGVCPVAGDQPPVPAQDRGWGDESVRRQRSGQESDQGGERRPVGPVQTRCRVLSAKDRVFVTQDQDLYVFGRTGTGEERESAGDAAERKVEQA
jgi:hypothetical protein